MPKSFLCEHFFFRPKSFLSGQHFFFRPKSFFCQANIFLCRFFQANIFAAALTEMGESLKQMADLKYALDDNVKQGPISRTSVFGLEHHGRVLSH
jgi:hypothetical protein